VEGVGIRCAREIDTTGISTEAHAESNKKTFTNLHHNATHQCEHPEMPLYKKMRSAPVVRLVKGYHCCFAPVV
jgi:hypothetical protein